VATYGDVVARLREAAETQRNSTPRLDLKAIE
jgi:hypothetical protein